MYTIMGLESIMMKWLIKGDKRVARGGGEIIISISSVMLTLLLYSKPT